MGFFFFAFSTESSAKALSARLLGHRCVRRGPFAPARLRCALRSRSDPPTVNQGLIMSSWVVHWHTGNLQRCLMRLCRMAKSG